MAGFSHTSRLDELQVDVSAGTEDQIAHGEDLVVEHPANDSFQTRLRGTNPSLMELRLGFRVTPRDLVLDRAGKSVL